MIEDPAAAAVALDPVRARLLAALTEPASAAALAARLGLTRQKVHYHLRALETHGLVEPAGSRQWGGLTERLFTATAASYLVSPAALGEAGQSAVEPDRLSAAYQLAVAGRTVREVAGLVRRAARAEQPLPTLTLDTEIAFGSARDRSSSRTSLYVRRTNIGSIRVAFVSFPRGIARRGGLARLRVRRFGQGR